MTDPSSPDPNQPGQFSQRIRHEQVSARVPEEISRGVFATGALVLNGPHEFIIDFLQSVTRPHQVVARVVLPTTIMQSMVRAMQQNFDNYTKRFGPMPELPTPPTATDADAEAKSDAPADAGQSSAESAGLDASVPPSDTGDPGSTQTPTPSTPSAGGYDSGFSDEASPGEPPAAPTPPSVEEIYGQLKLPEEVATGTYANTVMITHSPAEFCFDFITSFYPRSTVTARIFMSAAQVPRLHATLSRSFDQFKQKVIAQQKRQQQNRNNPPPPPSDTPETE
ncbi:MAG: DUF3467 domain-containing protein [Phycisphaeraceae bacterium]